MAGLAELTGDFQVVETFFATTTAFQLFARPDPTRWALAISVHTGNANVLCTTAPDASVAKGISVGPSGQPTILDFRVVGALVNLGWSVRSTAPNSAVTLFEVFYRPSGVTVDQEVLMRLAERLKR